MTNPTADRVGAREGREARKDGRPRVSPYASIKLFRVFHESWLLGWDAMDDVLKKEEATRR